MITTPADPITAFLTAYFRDHLVRDRNLSPNTLVSYRDTFKMFLRFASRETGRRCAHSDDLDHLFQTIPITCSDGSRSSVPDDADQSGGGRWRPEDTSFLGG